MCYFQNEYYQTPSKIYYSLYCNEMHIHLFCCFALSFLSLYRALVVVLHIKNALYSMSNIENFVLMLRFEIKKATQAPNKFVKKNIYFDLAKVSLSDGIKIFSEFEHFPNLFSNQM